MKSTILAVITALLLVSSASSVPLEGEAAIAVLVAPEGQVAAVEVHEEVHTEEEHHDDDDEDDDDDEGHHEDEFHDEEHHEEEHHEEEHHEEEHHEERYSPITNRDWIGNGLEMDEVSHPIFKMRILAFLAFLGAANTASVEMTINAPVLPLEYNATLLKIGTEDKAWPAWWTKTYYQYNVDDVLKSYHRFDFYNHYLNLDNQWNKVCSILFRDGVTYSLFPPSDFNGGNETCYLTHKFLPVLSPRWLKGALLEGVVEFKGLQAEKWRLGAVGDPDTIYFYAKVGYGDQPAVPLRSTNQANDPGATDWFDFTVGPQDASLFELPKACVGKTEPDPANPGCPPDFLPSFLTQKF